MNNQLGFLLKQIMKETDFHQSSKKGGGSDKGSNATASNNDTAAVDGKEGGKSKKVGIVEHLWLSFADFLF